VNAAVLMEGFSENRNGDGKISLFHNRAVPNLLQQFSLSDEPPIPLNQEKQKLKGLGSQRNR